MPTPGCSPGPKVSAPASTASSEGVGDSAGALEVVSSAAVEVPMLGVDLVVLDGLLQFVGLADLAPARLAVMHGSSFEGDSAAVLRALADDYDRRLAAGMESTVSA